MRSLPIYGLAFVSFVLMLLSCPAQGADKPATPAPKTATVPAAPAAQPAAKPVPAPKVEPNPVVQKKDTTRRFRTGTVISAQLTDSKIHITGLSPYDAPPPIAAGDIAYAIATVKLDKDRAISIYDYELVDGLAIYPCYALSLNGEAFAANKWVYKITDPEDTYSMLFIVRKKTPPQKFVTYKLQSRIVKEDGTELPFFNWEKNHPVPIKSIPATGNIGIDMTPPPPPKPPAPKTPAKSKTKATSAKAVAKPDTKAPAKPTAKTDAKKEAAK
ncbi:MAG: hypothetical protein A2020_01755 [Lentisphaerae bacterium GWF2_45_14]|nr:MAG: hypothetical protein A2020_01755 [Lentisphaerae bacterium GWF2_45_14]